MYFVCGLKKTSVKKFPGLFLKSSMEVQGADVFSLERGTLSSEKKFVMLISLRREGDVFFRKSSSMACQRDERNVVVNGSKLHEEIWTRKDTVDEMTK